jgi:MoxR-like ATPase
LLHAAQAHATVTGRDFVSPDNVKAVAVAALAHRIVLANGVDIATGSRVVGEIVGSVVAPTP